MPQAFLPLPDDVHRQLRVIPTILVAFAAFAAASCSKQADPTTSAGVMADASFKNLPASAVPAEFRKSLSTWSDFRGPGPSGASVETGLLREWPEGGPPRLWMAEGFGRGYGTVTIDDAPVYVQSTSDDRSCVFALSRKDAAVRWKTPIAEIYSSDRGVGPNSTPVVDGEGLYALSSNGPLVRLNAGNGSIAWSLRFPETFGSEIPHRGYCESPLIHEGILHVLPGGEAGAVASIRMMEACSGAQADCARGLLTARWFIARSKGSTFCWVTRPSRPSVSRRQTAAYCS